MFWPAVTSSVAGVAGGRPRAAGGARRGLGDELRELAVEQLDLAVELGDASCERAQRGLGGLLGLVQSGGSGRRRCAQRRSTAGRLAGRELLAQLLGGGDDQAVELR